MPPPSSPEEWAARASVSYHTNAADVVVGEKNQGGDLVESNLRNYDPGLPVELVWASRGKQTRAQPVAMLYEQGRVHHVGTFPDLEDQLCMWEPGLGEDSPDRLDALVWAMTALTEDTPLDYSGGFAKGPKRASRWG